MTDISEVSYRKPDQSLFDRLLPVARKIFTDTFSHLYDRPEFERFCDRIYGSGGSMAADFNVPSVRWRVASVGNRPIGYAKLTPLRAAAINPEPNALELQQLYVAREWHGTGVAEHLMTWRWPPPDLTARPKSISPSSITTNVQKGSTRALASRKSAAAPLSLETGSTTTEFGDCAYSSVDR